jgi:hypothetical protein
MNIKSCAMLLLVSACAPDGHEPTDTGRHAVACDIVPADLGCPRRLLCCADAGTCWVETAAKVMDCTEDSCTEALAAVCGS